MVDHEDHKEHKEVRVRKEHVVYRGHKELRV